MRNLSHTRKIVLALLAVIAIFMVTTAESCDQSSQSDVQREHAIKDRTQAFAKANNVAPTPHPTNFPLRKALVEFTNRQDELDHPWYVYILADTGNMIGYYVAKTVPVNACDFLSSTEDVHWSENGNVITSAPSLDGIYYGGSGASSGCDSWFFFDSATNALIQIRGVNWYSADQPLKVEAKAIRVRK